MDVRGDDLLAAVGAAREALLPLVDGDGWDRPAGQLDWTCRRTLDHIPDALLFYATHLASRADRRLRGVRDGDPTATPSQLLDVLASGAAILLELAAAAPEGARAYHPAGMADASGFLAMASDEVLVHTWDIAQGFGGAFTPPPGVCGRVLARLFPWAPQDEDPWEALLWANGRQPLGDRPQLDADWYWHCAPLDEWDGTIKRRIRPPAWE